MSDALVTLFYFSLAAFALVSTWGQAGQRQVGVVLFACWVASNLTVWTLVFEGRFLVFPILDALFALTCAKAWKETGSGVPKLLIAFSVLSIAANTAFAFVHTAAGIPTIGHWHGYGYALTVNIIFAIQCIITGGWGVVSGWTVRVGRLSLHRRGHPELRHGSGPD